MSEQCPRCNDKLDFICTTDWANGLKAFEYLCMTCFCYVQEIYDLHELIFSIAGELGNV